MKTAKELIKSFPGAEARHKVLIDKLLESGVARDYMTPTKAVEYIKAVADKLLELEWN